VAAIGIQILTQVDLDNNGNLVIVAVSLALGILPVAVPDFYSSSPEGVQIVLNSGITAASIAAIVLNLVFNASIGNKEQNATVGDELVETRDTQ